MTDFHALRCFTDKCFHNKLVNRFSSLTMSKNNI